jgi:SAM-dependent methyltransferase
MSKLFPKSWLTGPSPSREDVLWCYRELLEREPESEEAVRSHLTNKSFRQLVEVITSSAEYRQKRAVAAAAAAAAAERASHCHFHSLMAAPTSVDIDVTPSELKACLEKVKYAWEHLGSEKPHFSVLTESRFLPDQIDNSLMQFMQTGESEVQELEKILERHGLRDLSQLTCVEFGCGVGRLTHGLVKRFATVHGYDISRQHLELAEKSIKGSGNGHLHLVPAGVLPALAACDVYYSRIVLQHNPPPIIAELLRMAFAALNPGGIAVFQLPTYRVGYRFNLSEWLAQMNMKDMEMHCLPQWAVFDLIEAAGCSVLEVREDNATGAPELFLSNTFVLRKKA